MDVLMEVRQPGEIVALARARRSCELGRLPGWGVASGGFSPRFWQRLRVREGGVSSGTMVAVLRHALRQRQVAAAKEIFLLLLERIETGNRFWGRQTAARMTGIGPERARMMCEDLCQELTLHLWEELALRDGEGWELFFRRALAFARAHVATRYLERQGYRPGQRVALFFADVAAINGYSQRAGEREDERALDAIHAMSILPLTEETRDPFTAADLADLRGYVEQLPPRERVAVVMRYWQRAREQEIADALGVTTRTVRNLLRRANSRLYALYTGTVTGIVSGTVDQVEEGVAGQTQAGQSEANDERYG